MGLKMSFGLHFGPLWAQVGAFWVCLGALVAHMAVYCGFSGILCGRPTPSIESAAQAETLWGDGNIAFWPPGWWFYLGKTYI